MHSRKMPNKLDKKAHICTLQTKSVMELVWQDNPHIQLDPNSDKTHIHPRKTYKAHTLFLFSKASVQPETAVMLDNMMLHLI